MTMRREPSLREGALQLGTGKMSIDATGASATPEWRSSDSAAFALALKRALDIVGAIGAIALLAPLLLGIALAVKLDSPGPAIFRQRRATGQGRQAIRDLQISQHARAGGRRHGRAGAARRRPRHAGGTRAAQEQPDELPQLFNVLRGDMSLVGPRPHALAHDEQYGAVLRDYRHRARMKTGITGLAQISGRRGETADLRKMRERVRVRSVVYRELVDRPRSVDPAAQPAVARQRKAY